MPEYTQSIDVNAAAKDVFRFVSDVRNLPRYLPTVHDAMPQSGERVAVDGEANGHSYHSDGWFKVDEGTRTLIWGSDGENDYSGRMRVSGDGQAQVECTLRFQPRQEQAKSMEEHQGGRDAAIQDGLRTSLTNIKRMLEGQGGKQPSSAEV